MLICNRYHLCDPCFLHSLFSLTALAVGSLSLAPAQAQTVQISGAGATFPAPLLQRWFDTYNRTVDSNVQVSYQSVGSGAGLEQVINGTVDFGVSEAPFSGARLESFRSTAVASGGWCHRVCLQPARHRRWTAHPQAGNLLRHCYRRDHPLG